MDILHFRNIPKAGFVSLLHMCAALPAGICWGETVVSFLPSHSFCRMQATAMLVEGDSCESCALSGMAFSIWLTLPFFSFFSLQKIIYGDVTKAKAFSFCQWMWKLGMSNVVSYSLVMKPKRHSPPWVGADTELRFKPQLHHELACWSWTRTRQGVGSAWET